MMKEADIRKTIEEFRARLDRLEALLLPKQGDDDIPAELKDLLRERPSPEVRVRYGAIFPARKR